MNAMGARTILQQQGCTMCTYIMGHILVLIMGLLACSAFTSAQSTCSEGFVEVDGVCINEIECDRAVSPCDSNAICTDTIGSYTCACSYGFDGDGVRCRQIDFCNEGLDECGTMECTNLAVGYECDCPGNLIWSSRHSNCISPNGSESPTTPSPTTVSPTRQPTSSTPTAAPLSSTPTVAPISSAPSRSPASSTPTANPTTPTPTTFIPSSAPTLHPTTSLPTDQPTIYVSTAVPSTSPPTTSNPTTSPFTSIPSFHPTEAPPTPEIPSPTVAPTECDDHSTCFALRALCSTSDTVARACPVTCGGCVGRRPTQVPTSPPTGTPSSTPTEQPSWTPTAPTLSPTPNPSASPSRTFAPSTPIPSTVSPSIAPTDVQITASASSSDDDDSTFLYVVVALSITILAILVYFIIQRQHKDEHTLPMTASNPAYIRSSDADAKYILTPGARGSIDDSQAVEKFVLISGGSLPERDSWQQQAAEPKVFAPVGSGGDKLPVVVHRYHYRAKGAGHILPKKDAYDSEILHRQILVKDAQLAENGENHYSNRELDRKFPGFNMADLDKEIEDEIAKAESSERDASALTGFANSDSENDDENITNFGFGRAPDEIPPPPRPEWRHYVNLEGGKTAVKAWASEHLLDRSFGDEDSDGKFIIRVHNEEKGQFNLCMIYKGRIGVHSVLVHANGSKSTINKRSFGSFSSVDELILILSADPPPSGWPQRLTSGIDALTHAFVNVGIDSKPKAKRASGYRYVHKAKGASYVAPSKPDFDHGKLHQQISAKNEHLSSSKSYELLHNSKLDAKFSGWNMEDLDEEIERKILEHQAENTANGAAASTTGRSNEKMHGIRYHYKAKGYGVQPERPAMNYGRLHDQVTKKNMQLQAERSTQSKIVDEDVRLADEMLNDEIENAIAVHEYAFVNESTDGDISDDDI